jgi:hypothetical protein
VNPSVSGESLSQGPPDPSGPSRGDYLRAQEFARWRAEWDRRAAEVLARKEPMSAKDFARAILVWGGLLLVLFLLYLFARQAL